jgi:hypothetical protein
LTQNFKRNFHTRHGDEGLLILRIIDVNGPKGS